MKLVDGVARAIRDELLARDDFTEDLLDNKIKEEIKKFGGLLVEEGAIILIGKKYGLGETKTLKADPTPIGNLWEKQDGITISGVIEYMQNESRMVDTANGENMVREMCIRDGTGWIKISMWSEMADGKLWDDNDVGDHITIHGLSVRIKDGIATAMGGKYSMWEDAENENPKDMPEPEMVPLSPNMDEPNPYCISARVSQDMAEFAWSGGHATKCAVKTPDGTGEEYNIIWWGRRIYEFVPTPKKDDIVKLYMCTFGTDKYDNDTIECKRIEMLEKPKAPKLTQCLITSIRAEPASNGPRKDLACTGITIDGKDVLVTVQSEPPGFEVGCMIDIPVDTPHAYVMSVGKVTARSAENMVLRDATRKRISDVVDGEMCHIMCIILETPYVQENHSEKTGKDYTVCRVKISDDTEVATLQAWNKHTDWLMALEQSKRYWVYGLTGSRYKDSVQLTFGADSFVVEATT